MIKPIIAVIMGFMITQNAHADDKISPTIPTSEMVSYCMVQRAKCTELLAWWYTGATQIFALLPAVPGNTIDRLVFCVPFKKQMTGDELRMMFLKYAYANPDKFQTDAPFVLLEALMKEYPCR